jgi:hypothetical protein
MTSDAKILSDAKRIYNATEEIIKKAGKGA